MAEAVGAMGEIAVNAFILAKEKSATLYLEDCLWQNQINKQQPEGSPLWLDVHKQHNCLCLFMLSFICYLVFIIWSKMYRQLNSLFIITIPIDMFK